MPTHMNTETPKPISRVQTIQVRGRVFVTGMLWTPLGNMTSYMKEARQYGHEHGMDIVAIRRTSLMIQAGFVSSSSDVQRHVLAGRYLGGPARRLVDRRLGR